MTIAKRIEQLEQAIQPAGDLLPFLVLWGDPTSQRPGVYWRNHERTGEPLTDEQRAELEGKYETVFLVDYSQGKIGGSDE